MPETFRVPRNCVGLTLPNGQKVNRNRSGDVTVPDRFVDAVKRSGHTQDGALVRVAGAAFGRVAGKECSGCGTEIFAWQTSCRSCGGKDD